MPPFARLRSGINLRDINRNFFQNGAQNMEVFEDGALQAVNRIEAKCGQATLNMKISV